MTAGMECQDCSNVSSSFLSFVLDMPFIVKTIDTKNAERTIYPPLEQVVTLHLDMQANEKGFKSGLEFAMYD
jgi:hypothetical protein